MIELKFNSEPEELYFFTQLHCIGPSYGIRLAYQRSDVDEKVYYDGCKNTLVVDYEGILRTSEDLRNMVRTEE